MVNKKKGSTLLEVVISIAILAILIVPLSNMIIASIKINKKGEQKQEAKLLSQEIIEKIRSEGNVKENDKFLGNDSGDILSIKADNKDKNQFSIEGTINDLKVGGEITKRANVDNGDKYIHEDLAILIVITKDKIQYKNVISSNVNIKKILNQKLEELNNNKSIDFKINADGKNGTLNGMPLDINENGKIAIYIKEPRIEKDKVTVKIKNLSKNNRYVLFFKNKRNEKTTTKNNISEESFLDIEKLNLIQDINYSEEDINKGLYTVNINIEKNGQVLEKTESEVLIND